MEYGNYFCTKETYCVSVTALLHRGDGLVNKFMGDFGVSEEIPDQQTTYLKQRRMFEVCMPLSHFSEENLFVDTTKYYWSARWQHFS